MKTNHSNLNGSISHSNKQTNVSNEVLRVDVEKVTHLLNFMTMPDRPNSSIYIAKTDCMRGPDLKNMIFIDDDLTTEQVSVDGIIVGKTYVVSDKKGNILLGIIKRRPKAQYVYVHSQNLSTVKLALAEVATIDLVYKVGRRVMSDDQLTQICQYEEWHDQTFSADQIKMIDFYLKEYSPNRPEQSEDPFILAKQANGPGIPLLTSRQLYPSEMVLEAIDANTPNERRAQILDAFKRGYKVMQELDVPAYRILFVQYDHLPKIQIWFD